MSTLADPIHRDLETPAWAPCAACGVVVRGPARDEVEVYEVDWQAHSAQSYVAKKSFLATRCSTCRQIRDAGADLLRAHAQVRGEIGDPSIAEHRLECALNALDAIGMNNATVLDRLTDTATELRALLRHMTIPGGAARWAARLAGVSAQRAAEQSPSVDRWAHVDAEQRSELQRAFFELYAERIEKPQPYRCPSGGCALCGVAEVTMLPSQARARGAWVELDLDLTTVGGVGAESVEAHLCGRCDAAVDAVGGVGVSAMRRSVFDLLGVASHLRGLPEIGAVAWIVTRRAPNAEPWDHIDLTELREILTQEGILGGPKPVGDYQPLIPTRLPARLAG